jgi:hypothetical protein
MAQFLVHRYAQCLKGLRRRVMPLSAASFDSLDQLGKLRRGF